MSKKKTSTFYLTERLTITAGATPVTATIDLGAYVDVADRQAVAIEEVDFIFQGTTANGEIPTATGVDNTIFAQVSDLNRGGTIQFADDRALVASGSMHIDADKGLFKAADMYPDVFGARDGVRLVVNDQLYLTAESTGVATSQNVNVTVRVKAHVAGLTAKDWMAIAIQSTAADN
tara:strand:+ start:590 stop:1117 length:528 start_codon:yes stop_codon:yes gene_type:complete